MQVGGIGAYKGIMLSNRPLPVRNTIVEPTSDSPRVKGAFVCGNHRGGSDAIGVSSSMKQSESRYAAPPRLTEKEQDVKRVLNKHRKYIADMQRTKAHIRNNQSQERRRKEDLQKQFKDRQARIRQIIRSSRGHKKIMDSEEDVSPEHDPTVLPPNASVRDLKDGGKDELTISPVHSIRIAESETADSPKRLRGKDSTPASRAAPGSRSSNPEGSHFAYPAPPSSARVTHNISRDIRRRFHGGTSTDTAPLNQAYPLRVADHDASSHAGGGNVVASDSMSSPRLAHTPKPPGQNDDPTGNDVPSTLLQRAEAQVARAMTAKLEALNLRPLGSRQSEQSESPRLDRAESHESIATSTSSRQGRSRASSRSRGLMPLEILDAGRRSAQSSRRGESRESRLSHLGSDSPLGHGQISRMPFEILQEIKGSSISGWLDGLKEGWGVRYAACFEEIGIEDVTDLPFINDDLLKELTEELKRAGAKSMQVMRIREAMLSIKTENSPQK